MVEDMSVAEQTYEIINLEHALADAKMKLPEKFLVMSIVDKFPKSWENFGMTLKHQKGKLSLDDLMIAISIEEEHRNQTHKMPVEHHPRANLVVGKQKVNKVNSNSKAMSKDKTTKNKKPKVNKPCWNCGQVGHWAKLCPNKKAKTGQTAVNMVVGGASTSGAIEGYVSVQSELLTIYEPCDWLIDTGANLHVCADKSLFVSYQAITGRTVSMGNSSTVEVHRIGSMDLKFLLGHVLSLKRAHHVPTVRRNIISGSEIKPQILSSVGVSSKSASPRNKRKKLGPKTVDVVFLGYVESSYALRFLIIKSEISGIEVKTIVEFCDAVFIEDVFSMKTRIPSSISVDDSLASTSIPEHVEKMTNVGVNPSSTSLSHEELDELRRSKRANVVKDFGSDFVIYNIEDDPITFKDVMASSEAKQWKEAVKSEMDSIISNGTWKLVDLPPGCTTIGMDVKTVFLYGELEEEIYVDQPEGFVAYGSCVDIITETKSFLKNKFEMKDMGEADVILGIKLIRSTDGIAISQSHYVEKIIEKFGYQNSRIAKTPYDSSVALFKMKVPDIIPAILEGYSDASWIAKNSESNGCSEYVFTLCGGAVSWKSAKYNLITRSTFEAELCALVTTGTEAEWLFGLLSQLPILSQPLPPIAVHCDSQTTIAKVRSRKYNQKTKRHIQVRLKSIRALVSDRVIIIDFVGTNDNVADPLTKGLDLLQVDKFRLEMEMKTHQRYNYNGSPTF
ncbi:UNVERIFIED_CONTAM: Retrovirus-related Pol polyprotein from transposon TNT 1-94 [Sesamum radiatum]|uniref:Retrovirus-related Pol polyprotein from transposon TNT 1-94 n=1 Tax=Sesamum radiatum TaxID=300843 RepID=A0AAW2VQY8_SESRA